LLGAVAALLLLLQWLPWCLLPHPQSQQTTQHLKVLHKRVQGSPATATIGCALQQRKARHLRGDGVWEGGALVNVVPHVVFKMKTFEHL
jgi:hypothetical protein